eukprot:TRINITY_DN1595_c1_g1_i4.p1 TRINITY_DN1595_c1_g1~~TRINITY_DN1595_c1_g1_i4.p1  ORF type:complete len:383 (-),score=175.45 TRINITY_DN1595_c1_g1_i4:320-1468(-)
MTSVTICQAIPGQLVKKKTEVKPIADLRKEAAEMCNMDMDRFRLVLHGNVLADDYDTTKLPANCLIMIIPMPPVRAAPPPPEPVKVTDDDYQKFRLAFGSALRNPAFGRVAKRLLQRDNMDSLAAACPGLQADLVAQAFLTKPQLLVHLLDENTLKLVGEKHPSLLEAAHNLAAAVHEEDARGKSSGSSGGGGQPDAESSSGAYFLDDMSDEEMEEDGAMGGAAAGGQRQPPGQITAEQLAAALASAATGGGGGAGGNPFMGVTGMAPQQQFGGNNRGAGSSSQSAATTPAATNRLTADMFQAAMQHALLGLTSPQQQSGGGEAAGAQQQQQQQQQPDWSTQLATMRDMGIVDEGLARQALTVMSGDLQAAIELIFSGWLGE